MVFATVVAAVVALLLAGHGWVTLAAALAAGFLALLGESALFPNARCLLCRGKARSYGLPGTWRDCPGCGGSGRRRRLLAPGGR
ncbi:hypothetical protein [Pseudonocardia sp. ICBG601]|uniref:hypothetical protein n=1 Tax=Pseudonocardia sp. ICBG601 TaxID=2846759 RepID=UPI001CF6ED3D|nr:hypothetical protein [Pseudonocardia sp. ICBG601]